MYKGFDYLPLEVHATILYPVILNILLNLCPAVTPYK